MFIFRSSSWEHFHVYLFPKHKQRHGFSLSSYFKGELNNFRKHIYLGFLFLFEKGGDDPDKQLDRKLMYPTNMFLWIRRKDF